MIGRAARAGSHNAALAPVLTIMLAAILFVAILLLGLLFPLRYAHGWVEVFSEGSAMAAPMPVDGIDGGQMHRRAGVSERTNALHS